MNLFDFFTQTANDWDITLDDILFVVKYLRHYGYVENKSDLVNLKPDDVIGGVKTVQSQLPLKVDGQIGPKTLRALTHTPRCGCSEAQIRANAEALSRWGKKNLTYFVRGRDTDLDSATWDSIIDLAFQQWANVADLNFQSVNSQRDANFVIDIGQGRRDQFDGPGRVLAWAQLPPSANFVGQLLSKFDKDETWIKSGRGGIYLLNVACHEFGHLLGLGHSRVNSALMAPFYDAGTSKPQNNDDVSRMQNLYGRPRTEPEPEPNPEPEPEPMPGKPLAIHLTGNITKISIPGYRVTKMG